MGIVAEHIKKKLEQDIREKGLMVWLDKENEFTPLVDSWIQQKKEGSFTYDIFAFRGSFLELMVESKEVLSGKDIPKCIIHMPGFNEQDIKETPVLEAYKAGQRWRVSLETMIRESAQGRLSEDQTEFLLKKKGLDLSTAEEFITQEENMNYIRKGLIPKEMEDKWFVYWEDDTLFFHRSWTGYCMYIVHFENEQGSYRIISADVNRDPDQYKETREDRDKKIILYLIDILLLHKRAEFPDEKLSGDKQPLVEWGLIGRAMLE